MKEFEDMHELIAEVLTLHRDVVSRLSKLIELEKQLPGVDVVLKVKDLKDRLDVDQHYVVGFDMLFQMGKEVLDEIKSVPRSMRFATLLRMAEMFEQGSFVSSKRKEMVLRAKTVKANLELQHHEIQTRIKELEKEK